MLVIAGAAGCSNILDVELPGRIPSKLLNDPTTAPTLAASVAADFECAFSNYVNSTSTLSDQFLGASGNLNAKNWGTRKINDDDTANEPVRIFDAGATIPEPESFGEYRLTYRTGDIVSPRLDVAEPLALELADFASAIRERTPLVSSPAVSRLPRRRGSEYSRSSPV